METEPETETQMAPHERLALTIVDVVWDSRDRDDQLWQGVEVYDRLASRVRAAANVETARKFFSALCRKCHVAAPRASYENTVAIIGATPEDSTLAVRFAREEGPLLVALLRAELTRRKENDGQIRLF